jgi:hypothetical protein
MRQRIVAVLLVAVFVGSAGLAADGTAVSQTQRERAGEATKRSPKIRPEAGLIRLGSGNWRDATNTDRYGVIVASPANANSAGAQRGRALMYACGTNMPADQASALCGVSFAHASANGWILKDDSGNQVHYKGRYPVLVDIANRAYQRRFVRDIDADLRTHRGIDGLMIDDIVGSLITASAKYRDDASYRAATISFLRVVGPALRKKGWYVAVNASILDGAAEGLTGPAWNGTQYLWWARQIARYVDGIMLEHWQQNWDANDSVRARGEAGTQAWDGWERLPSVVASLGKDFYASETGAISDAAKASYLRASFLLQWKPGRGAFFYTDNPSGKGDPWRLVALPEIGRPTGPARPVGVGLRRIFGDGTVVVNPSPSESQSFGFQRKYVMPGGATTRSLTLPPTSGLVLRQASDG